MKTPMKTTLTPRVAEALIRHVADGLSIEAACKKMYVSMAELRRWFRVGEMEPTSDCGWFRYRILEANAAHETRSI